MVRVQENTGITVQEITDGFRVAIGQQLFSIVVLIIVLVSLIYLIIYQIFSGNKTNTKKIDAQANLPNRQSLQAKEKTIPEMSGDEFELHVEKIFQNHGWQTRWIGKRADNGVDIIAVSPSKVSWAIECKNKTYPIGNEVVRSVHGGQKTHVCKRAVVISGQTHFTNPAYNQARVLRVSLVHVSELEQWIKNQS